MPMSIASAPRVRRSSTSIGDEDVMSADGPPRGANYAPFGGSAAAKAASVGALSLSVVVPVYNEEAGLPALFARLYPALDALVASREVSTFIPALAYTYAMHPTEVDVAHAERAAGESKYSLYKLIRLNFDLVTGFSLVPLQLFSMFGMVVSAGALVTYLIVIIERLILSGWREGFATLWDRDILAFFLIGMLLFGLGLIGEYVGRIYQQVRERPRYTIAAILERDSSTHVKVASRL